VKKTKLIAVDKDVKIIKFITDNDNGGKKLLIVLYSGGSTTFVMMMKRGRIVKKPVRLFERVESDLRCKNMEASVQNYLE
jgi:hypothetical protein